MRTSRLPTAGILALLLICCAVILPATADAEWIGEYFPLIMNAVWTYENYAPPYDQYNESVFDYFLFEGNPAVRVGYDWTEHTVAFGSGLTVTVYAEVFSGTLHPYDPVLVLGEFSDGSHFAVCPDGDCETLMIRDWDVPDPTLRAFYDIDPSFTDLILIASYNPDVAANMHNAVLASNLPAGVTPPPGAVSNMDFYQRDVGQAVTLSIDAETGDVEDYYYLVDYVVAVGDQPETPQAVSLDQNFPNPFNPATTIRYALADAAAVTLTIHDAAGRLIRVLDDGGPRAAGTHTTAWRGLDDHGRPQPSGTYFCRLRAAGVERIMRLTLVR